MALKFLNKKGWHTGSLRNIENVWKAEQKHEAEQRKLEELRKQIQDERERSEFRLLQEQAGLVPRQERLEFLYDSGLSVGKSIGSGGASGSGGSGVAFKALEETAPGSAALADGSSSSSAAPAAAKESAVPGALFEDKPHSANDAWRKLHSDPLLLIRQREQEALARIKNNPVQMALIRKSVVAKKEKGESRDEKEGRRKKHKKHEKHSSSREQFDLEDGDAGGRKRKKTDDHKSSKHDRHYHKGRVQSEDEIEREGTRRKSSHRDSKYRDRSPDHMSESKAFGDGKNHTRKDFDQSRSERHSLNGHQDPEAGRDERGTRRSFEEGSYKSSTAAMPQDSGYRRRKPAPKLSEEERAARLQEMQMDAELHEEQRWKRVRKADEDDAREATHASKLGGRSFLDVAHKSVYGAEKGGSSTIEESVRRRTHYSQRGSGEGNSNAFRR